MCVYKYTYEYMTLHMFETTLAATLENARVNTLENTLVITRLSSPVADLVGMLETNPMHTTSNYVYGEFLLRTQEGPQPRSKTCSSSQG